MIFNNADEKIAFDNSISGVNSEDKIIFFQLFLLVTQRVNGNKVSQIFLYQVTFIIFSYNGLESKLLKLQISFRQFILSKKISFISSGEYHKAKNQAIIPQMLTQKNSSNFKSFDNSFTAHKLKSHI
jgi:hypothetical protein